MKLFHLILTTFALAERPFTKLPPEVVDSLLVASSIKTYAVDLGKKGKFREAQFYRPEPKFADFAAKAAPLFRDNLFGKLRTCIHQCAWKAKDLRSRRTQNNQRLMIASAGISDQLAAGLVGLMWQSSAAILERDENLPVDFDYFKQMPLYSEICFVPELVMIGFHQNILASLDESSELLMDKEILNLSPTEEERASLKFNVPIGNTSSITLDSSFEFVNLLDYEVFEQVSVEFGGDFQISLGIEPSFDSHLSTRQMAPTTHMLDEIIKPCSSCEASVAIKVKNLEVPIFVLMHFGDGLIQQIDGAWAGYGVSEPKVKLEYTDLWFC